MLKNILENTKTGIVNLSGMYVVTETIYLNDIHDITIKGDGKTVITAAQPIKPDWKLYKGDIYYAELPEISTMDRFFAGSREEICARYPNQDAAAQYFNGCTTEEDLWERSRNWKNPAGGRIHGMHKALWGDFHYEITGHDDEGKLQMVGGHQNNRPNAMHPEIQYADRVLEELDEPREWYFDKEEHRLYYYPIEGEIVEDYFYVPETVKELLHLNNCSNVRIENVRFENTAATYMDPMEPLLRSDWMIGRAGMLYFENCNAIQLEDLEFIRAGGNAVFVSGNSSHIHLRESIIDTAGASGICYVGYPDAVRMDKYNYDENYNSLEEIELISGPASENYPKDCSVEECIITKTGRIEKQSAGVQISMAARIRVSHCTIYNVPRSGINIGDGCFGGHCIENNDVFNTVLETGDHGSFNSWGRDRFWHPDIKVVDRWVEKEPRLPFLDVLEPIIMRQNRMQCAFGWDIDLDDGSSNYEIYENLCLQGGLKNREGYNRYVHHNVILESFHPHVWYANSGDRVENNVMTQVYKPIGMNHYGSNYDYNYLVSAESGAATELMEISGMDFHSGKGPAGFRRTQDGFILEEKSVLRELGLAEILEEPWRYGVTVKKLQESNVYATPFTTPLLQSKESAGREDDECILDDIYMKNLNTLGELSATGMYAMKGVLVLKGKGELHSQDVILAVNGKEIRNIDELKTQWKESDMKLRIWRLQREFEITI